MSNYLALLTTKSEDETKWLETLENASLSHHHVFSNFTKITVLDQVYEVFVDGEFYNLEEVKKSLRHKGIDVDLTSNEELVVYAYRTWKHAMMNHFIGAFAIVIDDGEEVFATKDQMGLKPIFYGRKKGKGIVISNALDTILKSGAIKPVMDTNGIRELFAFGPSISEDQTLYKDIYALPMGHYMVVKNNNVRIQQYYEPMSKPHFDSYDDTVAK